MHWYRFRGGPHDGVVAVAQREVTRKVRLRGQLLVDDGGVVVGRVAQPHEIPPAVAGQPRPAPPVPAKPATRAQAAVSYPDEQTWRRAVKKWALDRDLLVSNKGRVPDRVYDEWRRQHGNPVIAS